MVALNVVRTITIRSKTEGVDQSTASMKDLKTAHDQLGSSAQKTATVTDMASKSQLSLADALKRATDQLNASIQAQQKFAAANDNITSSYQDMEKAKSQFDRSIVSGFSGGVSSTVHFLGELKVIASTLISLVPLVNRYRGAIADVAEKQGLISTETADSIVKFRLYQTVLGSSITFLSRLFLAITVVTVAFKVLHSLWETGAALLAKYQNVFNIYGPNTDEQLKTLTKFQDKEDPATVMRAAELSDRLTAAKRKLSEFLEVQINLNGIALFFQSIWVNIVELIAKAVSWASRLSLPSGGGGKQPTPTPGVMQYPESFGLINTPESWQVSTPEETQANLMLLAKTRLASQLTFSEAGGENFAQRFTTDIDRLANGMKNTAFVDFTKTTEDQIKALKLEADTAGLTSDAIAELKMVTEGVALANKDGIPVTDEMIAKLKNYADVINNLNIQQRQNKILQQAQFDIATRDLKAGSPAEARAKAAFQIDPTNWRAFLDSPAAKMAAAAVKETEDAYDKFTKTIEDQIEVLKAEAEGAGKTSEAIERLKITHLGEKAAAEADKDVTDKMREQWNKWGDEIARANIQLRQTKTLMEERFKGATMFMSPEDQAAATVAKEIDPQNWQAHLQDAAAQLARFNSIMGQTRDLAVGFGDSFEQAMIQGKSATEALQGALRNLESQLLSMVNKIGINALMSLIPSPSLGGVLPGGAPIGQGGIGHAALGNVYYDGKVIPFARGGVVTMPTIFPMQSGMGLMGEAGPEAVMPLTRGSDGKLGVQGGGVVNNFIVENHTGGQVSEQKRKNSTGGVDHRLIIRSAVSEDLASGAYDGPMRARFGQQIRARPR